MKPALVVYAAFAAVALLHSLTVSGRFKGLVAAVIGERAIRAWYRLAFTAFTAAITAAFVLVYISQPDTFLYRPPGVILWPAHAFQLVGVYLLIAASRPFDTGSFTGIRQAAEYLSTGRTGGDIEGITHGRLVTTGVYGLVRHPMYLGGILIFAFEPNVTVNCLVLRVMASAYFVYGGIIEDRRLVEVFGGEYKAYRDRVPMFNIVAEITRRLSSRQ